MPDLISRQIEFSNGDRFWLLVAPDGVPDFDSARFLVSQYQDGKAPNTLRNVANAVRVVKRFLVMRQIDLKERLREGRILTRNETARLVADCGRPVGSTQRTTGLRKVVPLKKRRAYTDEPSLDPNTQRIRAFYAAKFITFLVDEEAEPLGYDNKRGKSLKAELKRFNQMINELTPKQEGPDFDPERSLTQDAVEKIMALSSEEQSELAASLFRQPATRKRNLIIVELFLATGARSSEIARLRLEDIEQSSLMIKFQKHKAESRDDKRANRPGFKTRERPIRVNVDLMRRLVDYVSAREGGRPRKAKHRYIFCSNGRSARAISLASIYRIIKTLEKAFGVGWRKRITPHVLRHTFFDMWFREADDRYDFRGNPQLFDQVVAAAELTGGWRPDSKMINHYKQRFVFEQASEVTLSTQKRMKPRKMKIWEDALKSLNANA